MGRPFRAIRDILQCSKIERRSRSTMKSPHRWTSSGTLQCVGTLRCRGPSRRCHGGRAILLYRASRSGQTSSADGLLRRLSGRLADRRLSPLSISASRGVASGSGAVVTMIYRTLTNLAVAHQKWRSFWVGSAALMAASFVASAVGALGRPLYTGCLRSRHAFVPFAG